MKKIIASAVGLMMVSGVAVTTASAVENQFGGYWRTRFFGQNDFNVENSSFYRTDNRTRLYLFTKFNDDFKFVNKFEFNTNWGDDNGGSLGADGTSIWRIKNSYADFNLGNTNVKLGIQPGYLARGFLLDNDFSGAIVTPTFGDVAVPLGYIAVRSEDGGGAAFDQGLMFAAANVKINDTWAVTPYFMYNGANSGEVVDPDLGSLKVGDINSWYLGLDAEMKMDAVSAWGTFIYNGGTQFDELIQRDVDLGGWLGAVGVDVGIGHGQFFYASGDSSPLDGNGDAFQSTAAQSYYWSEIMGLGIFDNTAPTGAPGDKISNVWAINAGVTFVPMDKMTLTGDLWYAQLAEGVVDPRNPLNTVDELGWELDGKMTYELMDNLSADVVLAYLFAGDAIFNDQNDALEAGVRISLKF
jgi:hypothetical protein